MIVKRGKTWFLRRRVPNIYAEVESRREVTISLKTDSKRAAERKVDMVWSEMISGWEALLNGESVSAEVRFANAKRTAQRLGFEYLQPRQVAELPIDDILDRVRVAKEGPAEADAALGLADAPEITCSDALEIFIENSTAATSGKTDDQMRRWRNPRDKASKDFIAVVGDKSIAKITRDDMIVYRQWLEGLVADGEITAATANKNIAYLTGPIKKANSLKGLGIDLPFAELSLKEGRKKRRKPFSSDWIRDVIIGSGRLSQMGDQARRIVEIMINTGARPSEIAGLMCRHLELDGDIPLMHIEAEGRQLKNLNSVRTIPLAGVSLVAARAALEAAEGAGRDRVFPNYFGKDKISATANKFMRENDLMENGETTLYSLRHSFEDRLIVAGVPDRVRRDLFGHELQEERYGDGGGDETRHKAVLAVAI